MIDQSNRAGKSPVVTVFKTRRCKSSSSQSPDMSPGNHGYTFKIWRQIFGGWKFSLQTETDTTYVKAGVGIKTSGKDAKLKLKTNKFL